MSDHISDIVSDSVDQIVGTHDRIVEKIGASFRAGLPGENLPRISDAILEAEIQIFDRLGETVKIVTEEVEKAISGIQTELTAETAKEG